MVLLYDKSPHPGGFFVMEIWFLLVGQDGLGACLIFLILFLVDFDLVSKPLFPPSLAGGPLFTVLILGGFPVVIYCGGSGIAFFFE